MTSRLSGNRIVPPTSEQLATKADLDIFKTELRSEIALLKWIMGFALALLLAVFGKLFPH